MCENSEEVINYSESHSEGDTGLIPALEIPRDDALEYHSVKLYNPPAGNSYILKWKCERCGRYYMDPKLYESEPCIPWEKR